MPNKQIYFVIFRFVFAFRFFCWREWRKRQKIDAEKKNKFELLACENRNNELHVETKIIR